MMLINDAGENRLHALHQLARALENFLKKYSIRLLQHREDSIASIFITMVCIGHKCFK